MLLIKKMAMIIIASTAILYPAVIHAQIIPVAEISPEDMQFPDTRTGQSSVAQTFKVTKSQAFLPLYIFTVRAADSVNFNILNDNCSGAILHQWQSCTFDAIFSPQGTGQYSTSVSLIDTGRNIVDTAYMEGKGVAPAVSLSQTNVNFGDQTVGKSSSPHEVIMTNSGTATLNIAGISVDNAVFGLTSDCGNTLATGDDCNINISFTPAALGPASGTVSISDDAADSPQVITLSGNGINPGQPDVALSTTHVDFGSQQVGTSSTAQNVTVTNTGTVNLTVNSIGASGDFSQDNNCPATLVADASCSINAIFDPTATGEKTGTVTLSNNATDSPQTINLKGTGIQVGSPSMSVSESNIDFGEQEVGTASAAHTITVTNNGPSDLANNASTIEGDSDHSYSKVDHCAGLIVPVGAACTIDVVLTAQDEGTLNATLQITNDAANSPQTIALTGEGVQTTGGGGGCSLVRH